jgi:hypothetical protein
VTRTDMKRVFLLVVLVGWVVFFTQWEAVWAALLVGGGIGAGLNAAYYIGRNEGEIRLMELLEAMER